VVPNVVRFSLWLSSATILLSDSAEHARQKSGLTCVYADPTSIGRHATPRTRKGAPDRSPTRTLKSYSRLTTSTPPPRGATLVSPNTNGSFRTGMQARTGGLFTSYVYKGILSAPIHHLVAVTSRHACSLWLQNNLAIGCLLYVNTP
jgi:hypothetical protein